MTFRTIISAGRFSTRGAGVDAAHVVLDGRGTLEVEGRQIAVREGDAVLVAAGADHRFTGYEGVSVLVVFARTSGG